MNSHATPPSLDTPLLRLLPEELVLLIYNRMSPEDIFSATVADPRLGALGRNAVLWQNKLQIHFPEQSDTLLSLDWYEIFQTRYQEAYAGFSASERRLFSYAKEGDAGGITALYAKNPTLDLNKQDQLGRTPLYLSAAGGKTAALIELFRLGADANTSDLKGCTPAFAAAERGRVPVLAALYHLRADLTMPNQAGETPVWIAAYNGHVSAITTLFCAGANLATPNQAGETPLFAAAECGHAAAITELCFLKANPDTPDHEGKTPAWIAVKNGHVPALTALSRGGASLTTPDPNGQRLAWIAARDSRINVLAELFRLGVNLNTRNQQGRTPAWIAACNDRVDVLTALYHLGVGNELNTPDLFGVRPDQIAERLRCLAARDEIRRLMSLNCQATNSNTLFHHQSPPVLTHPPSATKDARHDHSGPA